VNREEREWYRLDNAGKLFPSLIGQRITTFFRLSAEWETPICPYTMQTALDRMMKRCPYFQVRLQSGFFWPYLDTDPTRLLVEPDRGSPCMTLGEEKTRAPLRVRYHRCRIAVEFRHYVTDGTGAVRFLVGLLSEYARQTGIPVRDWNDHINADMTPPPEEFEDSFRAQAKRNIPKPPTLSRALRLKGPLLPRGQYRIVTATMPVADVLSLAKDTGVSLTEYLLAVYMQAFCDTLRRSGSRAMPVRQMVPVNLRPLYGSRTMRNFFLTVPVEIDPRLGEYTVAETAAKVRRQLREAVDAKSMMRYISRNVRPEQSPVLRSIPLWIKNWIIHFLYTLEENCFTSSLSNLGIVRMPPEVEAKVRRVELIPPPPSRRIKINAGVSTFKDRLQITFGKIISTRSIERYVLLHFRRLGVPVKVETNEEV
jgi:hypothetical protein